MGQELPETWALPTICDVVDINPGIDKSLLDDQDDVNFVPMPAVEAETGKIDTSATRKFAEVRSGFTPFATGDVLFAKITPCMENGKMAVVPPLPKGVGFGSTEFHVLRARQSVNRHYLYYFVSSASLRHEAQHQMTGAVGQKRVPKRYLETKPFPLPPLAEQHRIVEKIETLFTQLDQGEASLRSIQTLLTRYRQSVLKAAVTGQLTADWRAGQPTNAWRTTTLDELIEYLTSGSRGWAKYYSESGDIFIRAQNIKYDRLELSDIAYVDLPAKSEGTRTQVNTGDLLVTITGANVTKTALVEHDIGVAYVSQHVALVRPTEQIRPEFLYWFLIADSGGRKQLETYAYGAGKPGLNLQNIRDVRISLPTLDEQDEIVRRLRTAISNQNMAVRELERQFELSTALRQSILKDAFAGRLVPQDPNDEPASALLARIRAERDAATQATRPPRGKPAGRNARSKQPQ